MKTIERKGFRLRSGVAAGLTCVVWLASACSAGISKESVAPGRPMSANFHSWLLDHTASYVEVSDVACPDVSADNVEIICSFTGTIPPKTKIPEDNGLGLPAFSDSRAVLHDFSCTVQIVSDDVIDLVRCPTSIGWIFVKKKKKDHVA